MSGMLTLMPEGLCPWSAPDKAAQWRQQFPRVFPPSIARPQRLSLYSLQALLCNGHSQACRLAKGSLYTWSQSTPNSIILESGSRVASAKRLFTWAQTPQCYFASLGVFIMSVKGGQGFCSKWVGEHGFCFTWSVFVWKVSLPNWQVCQFDDILMKHFTVFRLELHD